MRIRYRLAVGIAVLVGMSLVLNACAARGDSTAGSGSDGAAETASTEKIDQLTVAIAGMVTPKEGLEYYQGLSLYVGEQVGLPVELIHRANYTQVNELLKEGKVDMAFVCSGPYASGHDEFGLELLVAPVVNGKATYRSYLIVPADSDATSMASLEGKRFAFTDPKSNTGYGVPMAMLGEMGVDPDRFFERYFYTYSHDVSIKDVAIGEADGASVDSLIFDFAAATDPTYTVKTRIVERSEEFGIPPVVVRPDLPVDLVAALRDALLLAHEDPEGKRLLDQMRIERFVEIDDAAYDSVRRTGEQVAPQ